MSALAEVERHAADVAAEGTDPAALAAVVAWSCAPRRRPDALRRRLRDARGEVGGGRPAAALELLARSDGGLDGPVADVVAGVLRRWAALDVTATLVGDPAYPTTLAAGWPTLDPPVVLAWRGSPPGDVGPSVAIVGSRRASAYGTEVATLLASAVAAAGARVVSGGAVGIDAAAHLAALDRPGGTTVVLGCGHGVRYPAVHARDGGLFDRIIAAGGSVVSELLPEAAPHPGVIRGRNRIVAGLADVTVVVEGGGRSGALLTATAAAERGREVLAVPGDVLAPGSAAPLRLLREGARPCTGPDDVLALLDLPERPPAGAAAGVDGPSDPTGLLPEDVRAALHRAGPRGLPLEDVGLAHAGPPGPLLARLTRARLAGLVEDVPGGLRLTRPSDR